MVHVNKVQLGLMTKAAREVIEDFLMVDADENDRVISQSRANQN